MKALCDEQQSPEFKTKQILGLSETIKGKEGNSAVARGIFIFAILIF